MNKFEKAKRLVEIEEAFLNVGINIRKNEVEYKSFPDVIDELSEKWMILSENKNKHIKDWLCIKLVGIINRNPFNVIMNKLQKKSI